MKEFDSIKQMIAQHSQELEYVPIISFVEKNEKARVHFITFLEYGLREALKSSEYTRFIPEADIHIDSDSTGNFTTVIYLIIPKEIFEKFYKSKINIVKDHFLIMTLTVLGRKEWYAKEMASKLKKQFFPDANSKNSS